MPEMMWRADPEVEAARKMAGWAEFHRECGKQYLYFDHVERQGGRRGEYVATTFTLVGNPRRQSEKVAEGRGKTVVRAIEAAFHGAEQRGFHVPAAEPHLQLLLNPDQLLIDIEDILG